MSIKTKRRKSTWCSRLPHPPQTHREKSQQHKAWPTNSWPHYQIYSQLSRHSERTMVEWSDIRWMCAWSPGGQLQRGRHGEWAHRLKEAERNPIRRENNMPPRRGNLILTDSTKAWALIVAFWHRYMWQVFGDRTGRLHSDMRCSAHLFGGLQQRGHFCLSRLLHHLVEDPVLVL